MSYGGEYTEEHMSAPADYNTLLLMAISRANKWGSYPRDPSGAIMRAYFESVTQVDILLDPYKDNIYTKEFLKLRNKLMKQLKNTENITEEKTRKLRNQIVRDETDGRLRCLTRLCARRNLFPGKRINIKSE